MDNDTYNEGYKTGRNWKSNYIAGGPYASFNDAEAIKRKKLWLEGFHDGLDVNRYKSLPAIKELLSCKAV